jgi:IclR family acetate operon transcriptional repressor
LVVEGNTTLSEPIRTVERALEILLCFSQQTPELSMTQISERVGVHKSTVHRFLATLEQMHFVQRDPVTNLYRPGIRLVEMAYLTLEYNDLRKLAEPHMQKLCELHRENVNLAYLDETDVVYLNVIESPQRVKLAAEAGQRLPAYSTASGKAILAFLPEGKVGEILGRGMQKFTERTIKTPEAFFENVRDVRTNGFAFSEQELEDGINAVAAPIMDRNNKPVASISVAGPAYRLSRERILAIGPSVVAAANDIARDLQMTSNTH